MTKLLLAHVAAGLLTEVVNHYGDHGATLPDRQVVVPGAPGLIAWDCEQVTVGLTAVTVGQAGSQLNLLPQSGSPAGVALGRLATWSVQVVRCSPTPAEDGTPPTVAELAEAGLVGLDDAGLLSECMVEVASLSPGSRPWLPIGAGINAGQVTALGPDGGFQGMEAIVTISAMEVG